MTEKLWQLSLFMWESVLGDNGLRLKEVFPNMNSLFTSESLHNKALGISKMMRAFVVSFFPEAVVRRDEA